MKASMPGENAPNPLGADLSFATIAMGIFLAVGAMAGVYQYQAKQEAKRAEIAAKAERNNQARIAREQAASAKQEANKSTQVQPAESGAKNIGDVAADLCVLLRSAGATTCDVNFNVLSASYIDATMPISPAQASLVCAQVAQLTRVPNRPFTGWSLKLFSPLGQSRPMAVCAL